ncbi:triphosphoribosyl-dephospho-CoA synthase [Methylobrevis albus]|uniref:Triphosphoribosyl-dephospho-CoA synthase n=1 Tax=Methylobrevis albus TaxID=2793297 RepID=A0A931I3L2_9HYPH|nr:triphosphoribosyl-dephospho-CoA synthase [Methylobrevis albus]MBH0239627.1 triphosphoribosyl-dephospho-CoA synthase [Methylobrevis albus]
MTDAPPPPAASDVDERLRDAFVAACHDELTALKPGNVHVHAPGHRMTVRDFEVSAAAAAPHLARKGASVGRRVRDAVAATAAAVGTNTNLGIVLLAAPIMVAAEAGGDLRAALGDVLGSLDVEDATLVFEAIRIASPGGLGAAPEHDVAAPPTVDLRAAMAAAAHRDQIARQYVTGFFDLFETGLEVFDSTKLWAVAEDVRIAAVYFSFTSGFPDSHVARKHGAVLAEDIMKEFQTFKQYLHPFDTEALLAFDADLKRRGVNPGTSADLTVGTMLLARLR